jgi:hypothetical protein
VARSIGARRIVEFGTSFGVSTIYAAAAARDNGGRVIGSVITAARLSPGNPLSDRRPCVERHTTCNRTGRTTMIRSYEAVGRPQLLCRGGLSTGKMFAKRKEVTQEDSIRAGAVPLGTCILLPGGGGYL